MVCDTYLQKPIVKSTFSGSFCKRLNTFDNFSTQGRRKSLKKVVKKSRGKEFQKSFAALLLFSAFFGVSLGNRVVEPQGP